MAVTDPRFDTSNWEAEAAGDNAVAGPSSSASEDESAERSVESDEDRDDESANGLDEGDDEKVVKGLTPKELEAFERKQRKRGIIYISRIPPGMTVPKVRHLLEGFGQVERMYLHDGRQKAREAETGKKKCECGISMRSARYVLNQDTIHFLRQPVETPNSQRDGWRCPRSPWRKSSLKHSTPSQSASHRVVDPPTRMHVDGRTTCGQ